MQISYEYDGFPEFLRSEGACKRAVELGRVRADTPIVVYEENGDRTRTLASEHPVLRTLLGLDTPEPEPLPQLHDAPPPPSSLWPTPDTQPKFRQPVIEAPVPPPARRPSVVRDRRTEPEPVAPAHPDNAWYWMTLALRNYSDFQGRARRKEYWMFALLIMLALVLTTLVAGSGSALGSLLLAVIFLGCVVPALVVTVRRLHDLGLTGWLVLVYLLPWVGALILLILMLLDGKSGTNQYGPNPKEAFDASDFE